MILTSMQISKSDVYTIVTDYGVINFVEISTKTVDFSTDIVYNKF